MLCIIHNCLTSFKFSIEWKVRRFRVIPSFPKLHSRPLNYCHGSYHHLWSATTLIMSPGRVYPVWSLIDYQSPGTVFLPCDCFSAPVITLSDGHTTKCLFVRVHRTNTTLVPLFAMLLFSRLLLLMVAWILESTRGVGSTTRLCIPLWGSTPTEATSMHWITLSFINTRSLWPTSLSCIISHPQYITPAAAPSHVTPSSCISRYCDVCKN
jgi:hypothetical protein